MFTNIYMCVRMCVWEKARDNIIKNIYIYKTIMKV